MIAVNPHSVRERDILLHMLGLNMEGRRRVSHRNYFAADPDSDPDLLLSEMEEAGLVTLRRRPSEIYPYNFYAVTAEGKDAVRRFFGEFREEKA